MPETFCLFVGYPRSGHSLVGYLLDAHPDAVIAHELDVLRLLRYRFSNHQVIALAIESAERAAANGCRSGGNYYYPVPGQWQGRHRELRVVGDKKGAATVRHLRERPELLDRVRRLGPPKLRAVHVTRNPFDNIARIAKTRALDESIDVFFGLVDGVVALSERLEPSELVTLRHEDLIADPAGELSALCESLGLAHDEDYVAAAASIVHPTASRTRTTIDWPDADRRDVTARAADVSFLKDYSFDD